jgi:hypothetical protein
LNLDIEFTVKIRAKDVDSVTDNASMKPPLAWICNKLLTHPCVLLILRQFVER